MVPEEQQSLTVIPLTSAAAQQIVANIHRHHGPLPPGYADVAIGCLTEGGRICGAVILGRPTNRNSDDGQTREVLRLATDGTPNAASCLLGAAGKAARAMGVSRLITYILDSETGVSLKAAGWQQEKTGISSEWANYQSNGRSVKPRSHYESTKQRWALNIREPLLIVDDSIAQDAEQSDQMLMWSDGA
jgi:hypothetical protein